MGYKRVSVTDKPPKEYRFTVRMPGIYGLYLNEKAFQSRTTITDVLQDLIAFDMRKNEDVLKGLCQINKYIKEDYLPYVDYKKYIVSPDWAMKREEAFKHYGYKCQICGTGTNLNVHHINYSHLGCEPMSDLTVLCYKCHTNSVHKDDIN